MKRIFLAILLGLLILNSYAQKEVRVIETTREMSRGLQPAFQVNIPESRIADVEKAWIRHQQKGTRSKVKKDKQEMSITGATIEGVQGGTLTLYSRLFADKEDVLLVVFVEIDSVFFLSEQDPDKARSMRSYLRDFALEAYRESVKEQVKLEEKKLQSMEKALQAQRETEKKNDRLARENDRQIRNLEDGIREKEADEERKSQEIEAQKDRVVAMKDFPEEKKVEEKALKSLQREKKKLQSQREALHRKIDKLDAGIKRAERDARIAQEKQKLQEREILRQQDALKRVKEKLDGIR
jgi:DNA repair exonuclease SbcCD ATPase subunit